MTTEADALIADLTAYTGSEAFARDAAATQAQIADVREVRDLALARDAEYRRDLAAARDDFEAYWAGSASASVLRDYRAGRVVGL